MAGGFHSWDSLFLDGKSSYGLLITAMYTTISWAAQNKLVPSSSR